MDKPQQWVNYNLFTRNKHLAEVSIAVFLKDADVLLMIASKPFQN